MRESGKFDSAKVMPLVTLAIEGMVHAMKAGPENMSMPKDELASLGAVVEQYDNALFKFSANTLEPRAFASRIFSNVDATDGPPPTITAGTSVASQARSMTDSPRAELASILEKSSPSGTLSRRERSCCCPAKLSSIEPR